MYEGIGIFRDREQADAYPTWGTTTKMQKGDIIFKNVSADYKHLNPAYDDVDS